MEQEFLGLAVPSSPGVGSSQGYEIVILWSWDLGSDPNPLLPICMTQGESLHLSGSQFPHL